MTLNTFIIVALVLSILLLFFIIITLVTFSNYKEDNMFRHTNKAKNIYYKFNDFKVNNYFVLDYKMTKLPLNALLLKKHRSKNHGIAIAITNGTIYKITFNTIWFRYSLPYVCHNWDITDLYFDKKFNLIQNYKKGVKIRFAPSNFITFLKLIYNA